MPQRFWSGCAAEQDRSRLYAWFREQLDEKVAGLVAQRTEDRKEAKAHGAKRLIEGTRIDKRSRVLLVDDVVTKGGSIMQAFHAVRATGATVVAAVTLVDRGDNAEPQFAEHGVPYFAVVTYEDLGIQPV